MHVALLWDAAQPILVKFTKISENFILSSLSTPMVVAAEKSMLCITEDARLQIHIKIRGSLASPNKFFN